MGDVAVQTTRFLGRVAVCSVRSWLKMTTNAGVQERVAQLAHKVHCSGVKTPVRDCLWIVLLTHSVVLVVDTRGPPEGERCESARQKSCVCWGAVLKPVLMVGWMALGGL